MELLIVRHVEVGDKFISFMNDIHTVKKSINKRVE